MRERAQRSRDSGGQGPAALDELLPRVARGDDVAFEQLYRQLSAPVFGLVQRVLRDPAQSEEVAQEVFLELWRSATRYSRDRGTVLSWVMTIAHRKAVDRVRSAQASTERDTRAARAESIRPFDEVTEVVTGRLEREQVRRCMGSLTDLQRESVMLAYYQGYTYREVAHLLDSPLGTVKTRLRDGLIRLRDCMGVTA
ncbi:ECF RNA polymerase sigma factor SigK [Actinocrispum wychmicini]|uniref:RNA polymerase sigma-70 factor (ECF subfamily) n=1 Tax=Actinocrispum wychmicini TaxID=1213861 RepID=A0A4R2JGE0_9PSEU|nr:ECF RNA polymerase sigma factor SigK [Actinocrispum wychmicini]TCO57352.1 RNA polymerase sigma-70 factor (ECF subfamily) [Actinocrispum wychmicini]